MSNHFRDELLERYLRAYLGDIDAAAMTLLREQLEWVDIAAGQTLMTQGEPGDAMYLSISGRLRVYRRDDDGKERFVRDMARGRFVGEMSLYTNAPRNATVVAVRDSVLVRLAKPAFMELLASSAQVSIALTRQIIQRLQTSQSRPEVARPVAMALLPITSGVDALDIAQKLAAPLGQIGSVCIVDAAALDRALGQPGLAQSRLDSDNAERRIALYLDELEASHDFVLLVGDDAPTAWTRRCNRRSDEMLLLADATQPVALHDIEADVLMQRPGRTEAAEVLVLLHPADRRFPRGTRDWLARRPLAGHIHVRPALTRDMARLARMQSRTAVGLVLAGGGARGCAHLGLYQALLDSGVEVDFVGGTSIGSIMATLIASDQPWDHVMTLARKAFSVNPTGDYNLAPLLSLITGKRLKRVVQTALHELAGFEPDAEDLWKNWFCVASNYSQATEQVIQRGPLLKALMSSIAIPGALPPVLIDGELLCDGGTFNNFPVDVMRAQRGIGKVIGADLSFRKPRRFEHDEVPGPWTLLRDRLRPRAKRRYRFPSLVSYLMNVTILYSTSRQRESLALTDLYFNPPLDRVGMLQWEKFDDIVERGQAHGRDVLQAQSEETLRPYRLHRG
jgi:NTE family protein